MKKSQKWVFHLFAVIILSNLCLAQSCYRDTKIQPERVMDAIGLKPGMVIGEAGAGRGYLTFKMVNRIGESGKIYANDIDNGVLRSIRNRGEREGINNITTVLGEVADPRFPVNNLDMVIMLHAFHDFEKKVEWLKNAKKYMRPMASLVIIDRHDHHTGLDKNKVSAMGEEAGLELVQYETFLQDDFIYVFKISERESSFVEPGEQRRNNWHPPVRIMDTLGLKPGMAIGDIGAGQGRFTVWFADRVGTAGKVYANDIDKRALAYLANRCEHLQFRNVETVLGRVTDPCIPKGVLDIAFMVGTYHHLTEPVELMRNIQPALKQGGILVIVEYDPAKTGDRTGGSSTSKEEFIRQAEAAGYEVYRIETFLDRDNMYFCRPKD